MGMEEALVARLRAAAGVASIAGTRVSWFERPRRGGFPCVVLTEVSPGREWTHGGPDGLDRPRVRFECWAESDTAAVALSRAVVTEMEQHRSVSNWVFHEGLLEMRRQDSDTLDGGIRVFRVLIEFTFFHQPQE